MKADQLHAVINDATLAQMRAEQDERLAELKRRMGSTYLLHPANQVERKPKQRATLDFTMGWLG